MSVTIEQRLAERGLSLLPAARPVGSYVGAIQAGNILYISGQLPFTADGKLLAEGKVGETLSEKEGAECAAQCFLGILSQAKAILPSLEGIVRILRMTGFVACAPNFTHHATIMDGASDRAVEILGEAGRHTRTTVGVSCLPKNSPVMIDAMMEIEGR